jgi:hypothetical protein
VTGKSNPTIAPICGDHAPAQFITVLVLTSPAEVVTAVISSPCNLIPVTSVFVKTVAPSFLAQPAYPSTTDSGVQ